MIDRPRSLIVRGFACTLDAGLGHLCVAHDGQITWDELQAIKTEIWGAATRAIEVYPRDDDLVDGGNYRHLWRLGEGDFCPDLLGHEARRYDRDSLEQRSWRAWYGAEDGPP